MRSPFLIKYLMFRFLNKDFRVCFKSVCQRALTQLCVGREESVFGTGEVRSGMLFVERGTIRYRPTVHADGFHSEQDPLDHAFAGVPSMRARSCDTLGSAMELQRMHSSLQQNIVGVGGWLSEGALFMQWHATGDAIAVQGSWL